MTAVPLHLAGADSYRGRSLSGLRPSRNKVVESIIGSPAARGRLASLAEWCLLTLPTLRLSASHSRAAPDRRRSARLIASIRRFFRLAATSPSSPFSLIVPKGWSGGLPVGIFSHCLNDDYPSSFSKRLNFSFVV